MTDTASAILLYDRFTHDGMERRDFMAAMVKLAGSVAAAEMLVAGIAASPAAARDRPANDPRLVANRAAGVGGGYKIYSPSSARSRCRADRDRDPRESRPQPAYRAISSVAWRWQASARSPPTARPAGGTPANEDQAREMIGKVDLAVAAQHVPMLAFLKQPNDAARHGKVGAVGFCWGGGFVDRLAVAAGDQSRRRRFLLRPRPRSVGSRQGHRSDDPSTSPGLTIASVPPRGRSSKHSARPARQSKCSNMPAPTTPSTTTPPPTATTSPPPTSPGSAPCASSAAIWWASRPKQKGRRIAPPALRSAPGWRAEAHHPDGSAGLAPVAHEGQQELEHVDEVQVQAAAHP